MGKAGAGSSELCGPSLRRASAWRRRVHVDLEVKVAWCKHAEIFMRAREGGGAHDQSGEEAWSKVAASAVAIAMTNANVGAI